MRKVADEDANNAHSAQERADLRQVQTRTPIDYFLDATIVGQPTVYGATMTNHNNFRRAKCRLVPGEGTMTVLHPLHDAIETLKMLPDESPKARILRMRFISAVIA
jgi:hypothetical protein